jgi:hypothetical protein
MAEMETLSCTGCGAPVGYTPGEPMVTCGHCGSVNRPPVPAIPVDQGQAPPDPAAMPVSRLMLANKFDQKGIEDAARYWMSKGVFKASDLDETARFFDLKCIAMPFWVISCDAVTHWSGMNKHTHSYKVGKRTHTVTHWVPASGDFSLKHNWAVVGCHGVNLFGLDAFNPGTKAVDTDWGGLNWMFGSLGDKDSKEVDLLVGCEQFNPARLPKEMNVVEPRVEESQGEREARENVINLHRKMANGKCTRLEKCNTNVQVTAKSMVHVPLWELSYLYKEKPFKILVNGGNGQVIKGTAPAGKWDKIVMTSLVILLIAGLVALAIVIFSN